MFQSITGIKRHSSEGKYIKLLMFCLHSCLRRNRDIRNGDGGRNVANTEGPITKLLQAILVLPMSSTNRISLSFRNAPTPRA